jgi:hypothetical protein
MTKYFDKLLIYIKLFSICYPSHGNMKNNAILGHVDFFWYSLEIINKNIFHYLMSKNPPKNHLNKPLSKSLNLNILIIFQASNFYLILYFKNFSNLFSIFWFYF